MTRHATPLKFLFPGWYALVMGLSGLALAWHRAVPVMGDAAGGATRAIGLAAGLVFVLLAAATLARARRCPAAWAEDRKHPVRDTFIATLSISLLLLATVAVALVVALQGMWAERLLPATFIFIAPPAVVGLSALQFGAPPLVG